MGIGDFGPGPLCWDSASKKEKDRERETRAMTISEAAEEMGQFFPKKSQCSHKHFPDKTKGNGEPGDKPQAMPGVQSGLTDPPSSVATRLALCSWYLAVKPPCKALPNSPHWALPKGSVRHSPNHSGCPESTSSRALLCQAPCPGTQRAGSPRSWLCWRWETAMTPQKDARTYRLHWQSVCRSPLGGRRIDV